MRFFSCVLSVLIHLLIFALGLYYPPGSGQTVIDLDKPVYEVDLVSMPKAKPAPQPVKSEVETPKATQAESKSAQKRQARKEVRLARKKPGPKPQPVKQLPDSQPSKAKQKPTPKVQKKQTAPPERKPAPQETSPPPTRENVLSQALEDIQGQAPEEPSDQDVLAQELASLSRSLAQQPGGSGGRRGPGSRTGVIFGQLVKQRIKSHWRFATLGDGPNLQAEVRITIDDSGSIQDVVLVKGSGRSDFDSSVLKAVQETESLPEPPQQDLKTITITFNSNERMNQP
jgi:colicin import membrane protein